MTVDLSALDRANAAVQGDPAAIATLKTYAQANRDLWHSLVGPPPAPPPAAVAGNWDATKAVVDPTSSVRIPRALASAGADYFSAGVARAYAAADSPVYGVPTKQNNHEVVTAKIPLGTIPGHTLDELLVVYDLDGTTYNFSGATTLNGRINAATGGTIMPPGTFTEPGYPNGNSSSGGRLPHGFVTPEDFANDVMSALTFSTANLGHGAARYPAETNALQWAGDGSGLDIGSWVALPPDYAIPSSMVPFEQYLGRRLIKRGAFLRDQGSTFMFYGSDQVNQGGQAHDWGAVGVTLEETYKGYPYAHHFSPAFTSMLTHLRLLAPPAKV